MKQDSKNILVITSWCFDEALIQTYTLPYLHLINEHTGNGKIFLVTFEKNSSNLTYERVNILNQKLNSQKIELIPFKYFHFGFKSSLIYTYSLIKLFFIVFKFRITHIHAWCTPAGMMGYLLSILTRKPLILDSYEPHAEPMIESNTWAKKSIAFRILFFFEKLQLKRAQKVIVCVKKMNEYIQTKYNYTLSQYYVKPACVDLTNFSLIRSKNEHLLKKHDLTQNRILVYAGKFGGSYLEDDFFQFCNEALSFWGDQFHLLLLSGHSKDEIDAFCKKNNFPAKKITHLFVTPTEIPDYIGLADMAITPFKPVPSKRYGTPIKTGEYWAMGLPVFITPNISDDSDIITNEKIGAIINPLNKTGYQNAITEMEKILKEENKALLRNRIRNIATKHRNYSIAETVYQHIYS